MISGRKSVISAIVAYISRHFGVLRKFSDCHDLLYKFVAFRDLNKYHILEACTTTQRVIVRCVIYFYQVNHTFFESKCSAINSFHLFFNFFK